MVTGYSVYVVRAVPRENIVDGCVDSGERVRPDIRRGTHEPLVRVGIELFERTAKHLHAIPVVEACQTREREVPRRREMVNARATRREVELLGIEVDVAHVLERVVASR